MAEGMSTTMKVAAALAVAAGTAYLASYVLSSKPQKKKTKVTVEVDESHLEWLGKMATTYSLPDEGKALRCLINFGVEGQQKERHLIFQKKRCVTCKSKKKVTYTTALEEHQLVWLTAAVTAYGLPDISKATRVLCGFGMSDDADLKSIFTVVRCTHGASCSTCK